MTLPTLHANCVLRAASSALPQQFAVPVLRVTFCMALFALIIVQTQLFPLQIHQQGYANCAIAVPHVAHPLPAHLASPVNSYIMLFAMQCARMGHMRLVRFAVLA